MSIHGSGTLVLPLPARSHVITLRGESLNFVVRQNPTLFHIQDWYRSEAFAKASHIGSFRLDSTDTPAAAFALAFVVAYKEQGVILWAREWVLTNDVDNNGDRVYMGRAAEYGGLQIHRRLSQEPI